MFDNTLAVIPARRGSVRFPGKNTAHFQGVPLAQNTIQIAKHAGIEKILVTTDDTQVITIAAKEGVKYLNRPKDLCTGEVRSEPVVENAVHYAIGENSELKWEADTICMMQVTSPLLRPDRLRAAFDMYFDKGLTSLVAIRQDYKPCGAFYIVDRELFMRNKSFYQEGGGVYMLPPHQCIDVDYAYDLAIANAYAARRDVF